MPKRPVTIIPSELVEHDRHLQLPVFVIVRLTYNLSCNKSEIPVLTVDFIHRLDSPPPGGSVRNVATSHV